MRYIFGLYTKYFIDDVTAKQSGKRKKTKAITGIIQIDKNWKLLTANDEHDKYNK